MEVIVKYGTPVPPDPELKVRRRRPNRLKIRRKIRLDTVKPPSLIQITVSPLCPDWLITVGRTQVVRKNSGTHWHDSVTLLFGELITLFKELMASFIKLITVLSSIDVII